MNQIVLEISAILLGSSILAYFAHLFRQPIILAYILSGVIIGPLGLSIIQDHDFVGSTAKVGIIFMLFLVGLEMNIMKLKTIGKTAVVVGVLQVLLTGLAGYAILTQFGFEYIETLYLGLALAFSSTILAIKLLSDSHDTKSLFGQITIGVLMVQDILIIIALLGLNSIGSGDFDIMNMASILVQGLILALAAWYIANSVFKRALKHVARSAELVVLCSMGWLFAIVTVASLIGFSIEIGAFIAGVSLANLPYTFEINAKAKILRDFFIVIFFAALGAELTFASAGQVIWPIIIMTLFVLIANPLIVQFILKYQGVDRRTGFFSGLTVGNVSEFSMVMLAIGASMGHVGKPAMNMAMAVMVLTMAFSTYMITYKKNLYKFLSPIMGIFDPRVTTFRNTTDAKKDHVVIIGYDEIGKNLIDHIHGYNDNLLVVEHNNEKVDGLVQRGIDCVYGDISNEELLDDLDLAHAQAVIVTIARHEDVIPLLQYVKELKKSQRPIIITHAHTAEVGLELMAHGADYVSLRPYLTSDHLHSISQEIFQTTVPSKGRRKKKMSHKDKAVLKLEKLNARNVERLKKKFAAL